MIAEVTGWDASVWVLIIFAGTFLALWIGDVIIAPIIHAVRYVRRYYREHPEAEPPDVWLVKLGLLGVRPFGRRIW